MKKTKILNMRISCISRKSPFDGINLKHTWYDYCTQNLILANKPKFKDWQMLYSLVIAKKGSMDGEAVEHYLKELFQVGDLSLVSKHEIDCALEMLCNMPDKLQD